jgi:dihydrofolate synthase/folylpolyglutamate synthase
MENKTKASIFLNEIEKYGSELGLTNMKLLMEELDNIQDQLTVIHVAGTNGKGSVCTMMASILVQAGYKTGKYTSPHVFTQEEKYQINGTCITQLEMDQVITPIKAACERLVKRGCAHPTLFEVETAAAFLWFWREECQMVILETGLGGALDATNIIKTPLCSIITAISSDHLAILGASIEQIARQKAGIIKAGCPVVAATQLPQVAAILEEICSEKDAPLFWADKSEAKKVTLQGVKASFDWGRYKALHLGLAGLYQVENAICVLKAVQVLECPIAAAKLREGLGQAVWPGRFEQICTQPQFIIDGAHNENAAEKLRETLEIGFTNRSIIYIIGILADKEYEKILTQTLPLAKKVYTITPNHPRALHGEQLCQVARAYHPDVTYVSSIETAVKLAFAAAKDDSNALILAFGTLTIMNEIRICVEREVNHD